MVAGAGLRRTGRRAALIALMALTASCEDPQPGLQDKVRVEKVVSCKDAIGHFAKTDKTRNQLDGLTDQAKRWGAKGLVWMKVEAEGTLTSPVAKFLSDDDGQLEHVDSVDVRGRSAQVVIWTAG